MKFLVDAQLPARLARLLGDAGHDAVHTSQLPEGNRTTDARISALADDQDRVVVSEDRDFRDGYLLQGSPRRLLVIATGNITNAAPVALLQTNTTAVVEALTDADFVELGATALVVHPRHSASE